MKVMVRAATCLIIISGLILASSAEAQRVAAPPAEEGKKKKKRTAPTVGPKAPVRKAVQIDRFEPPEGPPKTEVTLHGKHIDDSCRVRFNGRPLKILQWSPTELKVRIPPKGASDKFVVLKSGFREITLDAMFHVLRPPKIRTYQPRQAGAGDTIVVYGSNFHPGDKVYLGALEMPRKSFKPDRIELTVPGEARTAHLILKREGKQQARAQKPLDILLAAPTITDFQPDRGEPGTMIRVEGRNFEPGDHIRINGKKVPIKGRGPGHFQVQVTRKHTTGQIVLLGRRGRRVVTKELFTVVRPAKIKTFAPRYGAPGTRITVQGTSFLDGDQVVIGDAILTGRSLRHNQIVADLPAGVDSGRIGVRRGDRTVLAKGNFQVILPPGISEIAPPEGPAGTRVTIKGKNFLKGIQVMIAGKRLKIVHKQLPHEVSVIIPEGVRSANIVVVTRAGSARSEGIYKVRQVAGIGSFFPLHALPGTDIRMNGSNFHEGMKVFLGDKELAVKSLVSAEVVVNLPEGAPSGKFKIVSYGREVFSPMAFTVDEPKPELEFSFSPQKGRRGSEVTLTIDPPHQEIMIFFGERPLPKKTLQGGKRVVVTIPSDARTGHFEVDYNGRRYRAEKPFKVR